MACLKLHDFAQGHDELHKVLDKRGILRRAALEVEVGVTDGDTRCERAKVAKGGHVLKVQRFTPNQPRE